jgi:hypothetical protein
MNDRRIAMFMADVVYHAVEVVGMIVAVLLAIGIFGMWMAR